MQRRSTERCVPTRLAILAGSEEWDGVCACAISKRLQRGITSDLIYNEIGDMK